jgi:hypothetical protein
MSDPEPKPPAADDLSAPRLDPKPAADDLSASLSDDPVPSNADVTSDDSLKNTDFSLAPENPSEPETDSTSSLSNDPAPSPSPSHSFGADPMVVSSPPPASDPPGATTPLPSNLAGPAQAQSKKSLPMGIVIIAVLVVILIALIVWFALAKH